MYIFFFNVKFLASPDKLPTVIFLISLRLSQSVGLSYWLSGCHWRKCEQVTSLEQNILTRSNSEDRRFEPSPHIGNSLGEVVGKSPLLKGGQTVCDDVSDLGQVSKVAAHVHDVDLKCQKGS